MADETTRPAPPRLAWFDPATRRRRFLIYLLYYALAALYLQHRLFVPVHVVRTEHFVLESCETLPRTEETARAMEAVRAAWVRFFSGRLPLAGDPGELRSRLYRDRPHFRRASPIPMTWGEAYYAFGVGHGYYDADISYPASWLVHETVHQLDARVGGFDLPRWLEEGIATYFSTSRILSGEVRLGDPAPGSYPCWWIKPYSWTGDLAADKTSGRFIPLRALVTGEGAPDLNKDFNKYYVEWWGLVHFMIHAKNGRHLDGFFRLVAARGTAEAFEREIGPFDAIEAEWYRHLRDKIAWRVEVNADEEFRASPEWREMLRDHEARMAKRKAAPETGR